MTCVLVVEDNPANLKLASVLLSHAGYTVLSALDAESGLTLARSARPDLVLMDVQLPGMDGLAATALLKSDPATAGIPIIALTAHAMAGDREKTVAAGCNDYHPKPVDFSKLLQQIEALTPGAAVRA